MAQVFGDAFIRGAAEAAGAGLSAAQSAWADMCVNLNDTQALAFDAAVNPWLHFAASKVMAALASRDFAPVCGLMLGLLAVLLVVLNVLAQRAAAEAREINAKAAGFEAELRQRQRQHVIELDDRLQDVEALQERRDEARANLYALKQRCARRVAFVRHLRAVNANIDSDMDALHKAFRDVVAEVLEIAPFAFEGGAGAEDEASSNSPPSLAYTSTLGSSAESAPEFVSALHQDITPARRNNADAATPAARLFASPASDVATEHLGRSPAPNGDYAEEGRKLLDSGEGDALIARVAGLVQDATQAAQDRDAAMMDLHVVEREREMLVAELREVYASHAERMEATRELVDEARETIAAEATPQRRQRAVADLGAREAAAKHADDLVVTEADVEALPFDAHDDAAVADYEAECEELDAGNATLLADVTAGYEEMDELAAMVIEQEATIAALEATLLRHGRALGCDEDFEEDDEENDADLVAAAAARDRVEHDGASPSARDHVAGAPLVDADDVAERSAQRTSRISGDIAWVANVCETAAAALNESVDRLTMARHEQAELLLEQREESAARAEIHDMIRAHNDAEDMDSNDALERSADVGCGGTDGGESVEEADYDGDDYMTPASDADTEAMRSQHGGFYANDESCVGAYFSDMPTMDAIVNPSVESIERSVTRASTRGSAGGPLSALQPIDMNRSTSKSHARSSMALPSPGAFSPVAGLNDRAASVAVDRHDRTPMMRDYLAEDDV